MKKSMVALIVLGVSLLSTKAFAVSCAGIPAWNSSTVYATKGLQVQKSSKLYSSNYWTQGNDPDTNNGPWAYWLLVGTCDGGASSSSVVVSSSRSSVLSSARSSVIEFTSSSRSSIVSSAAPSSSGGTCSSPQFVNGATYATGALVKNVGNEYRCTVGGWCSIGGAYEPGVGWAWTNAWELVRSCGAVSSSSIVASSSRSSVASSVVSSVPRSSSSVSSVSGRYHVISGYWHNFNNGSGVIPIDQVADAYDSINVSFAEPVNPLLEDGLMKFVLDPAFDKAAFKAGIKAKQAAGKKIVVSIGGEKGHVVLSNAAARTNFVNTMKAIIDEYGFDGLDVDFEGQSLILNADDKDFRNPTTPRIVNLIGALNDLSNYYGSKFVLTMAPETFFVQVGFQSYGGTCSGCDRRAGAYLPVIHALRDKLTWLQVQNYNSGPIMGLDNIYHTMGGADFHVAMIDMLLTGFKIAGTDLTFPPLRQDQVLIGLPAMGSAGNGFTPVSEVQSAMNCLVKLQGCSSYQPHTSTGWRGLRGLMTWSINWDKYNGNEFANSHRPFLDQLPTN